MGSEGHIFGRRNIGIVHINSTVWISVLNVEESIRLPMDLTVKNRNYERGIKLRNSAPLRQEKSMPDKLSGGQQQRISTGRALINAPAQSCR